MLPEETDSYAVEYAAQAEEARPPMPRRITEERPQPRTEYSAEKIGYPQTPSYRAASERTGEDVREEDYYANDVPYEEVTSYGGLSSAPNVEDEILPPLPERSAARDPLPPARETAPSPAASEEFPAREPSAPPASDEEARERAESIRKEEEFRSLFSRSVPTGGRRAIGFGDPEEPAPEEAPLPRMQSASSPAAEPEEAPSPSRVFGSPMGRSASALFDDDDADEGDFRDEPVSSEPLTRGRTAAMRTGRDVSELRTGRDVSEVRAPAEAAPAPVPKKHVYKAYIHPDQNIFRAYSNVSAVSQEEIARNSEIILETLAGFRVEAKILKVTVGATVTRYDIDIPGNVPVRSVLNRDEEIAMRLRSRNGVNMYSNSEAGAVSIEVPNDVPATVGIRGVMQAEEFVNGKPGALMFAIGQDVEGRNVIGNIVKMTHILVAGATNSGKSVALNAMLVSLICKYSPEDLRFILIDPKKAEFIPYEGIPHLIINEIITDAQKAITALNWAIKEMERRFTLFEAKIRAGISTRNVDEYNEHLTEDEQKLPKIVIVVDEFAELMAVAAKDIEERIQRLTQKARASGIHLVLATQRPSVDVITGVIKGNLPTRMACRVIQRVDSGTILDEAGAEKLLGNGDMLYKTGGMFECKRLQGAFVSSEEVQEIVKQIKTSNEAYFDPEVTDYINKTGNGPEGGGGFDDDGGDGGVDPQYIKALGIVVQLGTASISLIQRKCSVGYNHAGKIIEWMEAMGYISPFDGKAKARTVLLTKEDYEDKYGGLD